MKVKRILKFYFCAESLERAIDNLILKYACASFADGEESAEAICRLIGEKNGLGELWNYLDGVVATLSGEERESLKTYCLMRCGLNGLDGDGRRSIKRAAMKFMRRARRLESFGEELALAGKYYCLLT